jgi:stage II sporulation protein D
VPLRRPRPLLKKSALVALSGLLGGLVASVAAAPPAAAEEIYVRDADGSFAIEGHGWGHGHGMSQWGAQGGASLGRTVDQITGFYYPGTAKTVLANTPMRVLLQADTGGDTQVYPAGGLAVTDLATGAKATLPTGVERWRSVVDSAGLHVQNYASGAWHNWALLGRSTLAGPVQFGGPTFVRVIFPNSSSRDYRGTVRSVKTSNTTVGTVNVLPMESYLMGVVPRESSASWQPAALQAQAVAARSYSAYKREHAPASQFFDICDTTQCQVYGGAATWSGSTRTSLEPASTNDAIKATAGVVRTYQGASIFAEFSSSNGGWSTDGGVPYLKAQRDDWDGAVSNGVHSWTAGLTSTQLERRFPSVGTLRRIRVTQRDGNGEWGGRVKQVVLEGVDSSGAATSVTTTGAGVYNANTWPASSDGLRSSWWRVAAATSSTVVGQSVAPTLVQSPGISTGTLTATLRNSGTTTWSSNGLHLAVASPPGQADPLVGGSTTPGVYTGTATTIAPGETAAFRFDLTGDGVRAGLQGRSYRLRNGTGGLFGTTVSWQVPVNAPVFSAVTAARPVSTAAKPATSPADAPNAVFADGRTVVVPVTGSTGVRVSAKNTGNVAWPAGATTPVVLGTSGPRDRTSVSADPTWVSPSRPVRMAGTAAVNPGGAGTFDLTLNGNSQPVGVTTESFEPLWEAKHWLDGASTPLTVVRVDPAASRLATVDDPPVSTLALTSAPSGTATLRVRLRNLGGQPWTLTEEGLSASATPLSTTAWSSPTTPPKLAGNVTRPGQSKVYPGEVGEWRVPLSAFRKAAGSYPVTVQPIGPGGATYGPKLTTKVTVTRAVYTGTLVRVSPTVNVPRGGYATAWFDVKNTGNVPWAINSSVRSEALTSGGSPSRHTSWLSATRPGPIRSNVSKPGTTVVNPGEVARFIVVLAGNGRTAGARTEDFGVLWESWTRLAGLRARLAYAIV